MSLVFPLRINPILRWSIERYGIPSIEFYVEGSEDFAAAAEAYELLQSTDGDFLEVLKAAGLLSPFEEDVYKKIEEAFS